MRENDRIEPIVRHDLHDTKLQLGALLQTQAIAIVQLEALRFLDVVPDVRMKLARGDDLLQRFDWRVAGDEIGVDRRFKFVEMNADVGGDLPAIEIWGVEFDLL
jgi:hypothetical protein